MSPADLTNLQSHLVDRREKVKQIIGREHQNEQLVSLLKEIDSALERIHNGSYGICEVCNESIEPEYLRADPLVHVCLGHLSPDDQQFIERDLELAARVQGKLLPGCNTRMNNWELCYHYEPSGPVGGDYCDLIRPEKPGGDLYFFLGDVSGKGVAASLLVSYLHATFRSLIPGGLDLARVMERANRLLCETTLSSNFVTLAAGRASPDGRVEIVNAGHCLPLVVRKGEIKSIETTGLPLGLFFSADYRTVEFRLDADDLLFIYSDGLSEARNPGMEEYSDARISALVARDYSTTPEDIIGKVLRDLSRFRGNAEKFDDLTIMAMRRTQAE